MSSQQMDAAFSVYPFWRAALLVAVLLNSGNGLSSVDAAEPQIRRALQATVCVETQRSYQRQEISGTGSGFFVHPDGYVLTSLHVVSDQVHALVDGKLRRLRIPLHGIKVVVRPGTGRQRTFTAEVVAQDKTQDLALLKIDYRSPSYLEPLPGATVDLADEVTAVGCPFGELPRIGSSVPTTRDRYPEPGLTTGQVTSLRRDEQQLLVAVETDAAITPGSSGGPLLDSQGNLVGVVWAEIGEGTQIGLACSPRILWSFYQRQTVRVSFSPSYVPIPRSPVQVTAEPGVLPLQAARGMVRVEGQGFDPVQVRMVREEGVWKAALQIPSPVGEQPGDAYVASLHFSDRGGNQVLHRSFRLVVVHVGDEQISDIEAATEAMADRRQADATTAIPDDDDQQAEEAADRLAEQPPPGPVDRREGAEGAAGPRGGGSADQQDLPTPAAPALAVEAVDDETVAEDETGTAEITVVFQSPLRKGSITLKLDGEALPPIEFKLGKELGRITEVREVPSGEHTLEVALIGKKPHGSASFTEALRPGSRWTLRINLPSEEHQPGFFFVERR